MPMETSTSTQLPESVLPSAASLLGLPSPTPENHAALIETILSELQPSTPAPAALSTVGYTGPSDPAKTTEFLLSSLLTRRLEQAASPSVPKGRADDAALADSLSRLLTVLGHPPTALTLSTLPSFFRSLKPHLPPAAAPLAAPLDSSQRALLERVHARMAEEHSARVSLLLTRLDVTVAAFSRSDRLSEAALVSLDDRVQRLRRSTAAVSVYRALVARVGLLAHRRRTQPHAGVKTFLMGAVPDRGGRLTGQSMPEFRRRLASGAEIKADRKSQIKAKAKAKAKGKGKRRGSMGMD